VRVTGLGECPSMGPVPAGWAPWQVSVEVGAAIDRDRPESVGPDTAFIRFGDGSTAEAFRTDPGGRIDLNLENTVPQDDLAHPYLSAVGMLSAFWGDRLPLHAGSFGLNGRAWVLVATKEGGKSTTLAMLDLAGHPVLADDMTVIDPDHRVHRGPRLIDLRSDAAASLGVGDNIGVLGVRERWRYHIGDGPLTLPLGGIIVPGWGEHAIELVAGSSRLTALAPSLALRVPAGWDELFMDVALGVPVYRWTRPRSLEGAHHPIEHLLEVIDATA
jgi:hypothetical protein